MSILFPNIPVHLKGMTKVTQNLLASLHKHVHVCFCKMCFTRLGYLPKLKLH